ncbi:hypothetical protein IFM89_011427 [Coptis chinensis]|uniref:Uncharacterized protein n=1 Tax=Coptis chinensis TaxID=261450 RepID=A0A835IVZ7_9MAGN|nr:hypothetical protein IFM89_011427 [Coptis chinensis]
MDSHYSTPSGSNSLDNSQLNDRMDDDAPISGSSAASKRRGPSIGIEEVEGYIARRDIPICHSDWRNIDKELIKKVVSTLGCQFEFEYDKTIDTDYTWKKLNEAWRNYKHTLYEDFVQDEDPSLVKEVAPRNIPLEDWQQFVDYCNTDKFKNSIKNHVAEHPGSQNDLAGDVVAKVVRRDSRGHFRGLERRIEVMEVNMDARMLSQMEEVKAMFMSQRGTCTDNVTSPHSRASHQSPSALGRSVELAASSAFGALIQQDQRTQQKQQNQMTESSLLTPTLTVLTFSLSGFISSRKDRNEVVEAEAYHPIETAFSSPQCRPNLRVRSTSLSSIMSGAAYGHFDRDEADFTWEVVKPLKWTKPPSLTIRELDGSYLCSGSLVMNNLGNAHYIGKDCELRGSWPLDIVARGVVQDVNPNTECGERTLEEGNFKKFVQVVCDHNATLPCPHNGWVRTFGQVVQGGVIWPKELLVFASHSSSS